MKLLEWRQKIRNPPIRGITMLMKINVSWSHLPPNGIQKKEILRQMVFSKCVEHLWLVMMQAPQ